MLLDEQTLAIRNTEDNSGTQRTALQMCPMPGLHLGCAWLREGRQIVHGCAHRTSETGQTKGRGGLRGCGERCGGAPGDKGTFRVGRLLQGCRGLAGGSVKTQELPVPQWKLSWRQTENTRMKINSITLYV